MRNYFHKRRLIPGFTKKYNVDRLVYFECLLGSSSRAELGEATLSELTRRCTPSGVRSPWIDYHRPFQWSNDGDKIWPENAVVSLNQNPIGTLTLSFFGMQNDYRRFELNLATLEFSLPTTFDRTLIYAGLPIEPQFVESYECAALYFGGSIPGPAYTTEYRLAWTSSILPNDWPLAVCQG